MTDTLRNFEKIARRVAKYASPRTEAMEESTHPFDQRNIHPEIAKVSLDLFDNGHYSQATFEAFKYIDKKVAKLAKTKKSGFALMMDAFKDSSPTIQLNSLGTTSETDEQKGYQFLFSGTVLAIRNPRGHEVGLHDSIEQALDHLGLASMLLRRLSDRVAPK